MDLIIIDHVKVKVKFVKDITFCYKNKFEMAYSIEEEQGCNLKPGGTVNTREEGMSFLIKFQALNTLDRIIMTKHLHLKCVFFKRRISFHSLSVTVQHHTRHLTGSEHQQTPCSQLYKISFQQKTDFPHITFKLRLHITDLRQDRAREEALH